MYYILSILYFSLLVVGHFSGRLRFTLRTYYSVFMLTFGILFVLTPLILGNEPMREDNAFNGMIVLALIVGFGSFYVFKPVKEITQKTFEVSKSRRVAAFAVIFIVMSLMLMAEQVAVVIRDHGLNALFTGNRVQMRLESYYGGGGGIHNIINLLRSIVVPFALIGLSVLVERDRRWLRLCFPYLGAMAVVAFLTAPHRTAVAAPLLLAFLFFTFYVRRIPLLFVFSGVFLLVLGLSAFDYIRHGRVLEDTDVSDQLTHGANGLMTSSTFFDMRDAIQEGQVEFEWGKSLYYYIPVTFIPRAFWPEKPVVNFNPRWTEKLYTGRIGEGEASWVRTFTAWGEGYAQFGGAGVVLYSFLIIAVLYGYYRILGMFYGLSAMHFYCIAYLPINLRGSFDSLFVSCAFNLAFICLALPFYFCRSSRPICDKMTASIWR